MAGKKLPGEEPTAIQSPSMAIMSGQSDPDKMDGPVCSPKGGGFKMPGAGDEFAPKENETATPIATQVMNGFIVVLLEMRWRFLS